MMEENYERFFSHFKNNLNAMQNLLFTIHSKKKSSTCIKSNLKQSCDTQCVAALAGVIPSANYQGNISAAVRSLTYANLLHMGPFFFSSREVDN